MFIHTLPRAMIHGPHLDVGVRHAFHIARVGLRKGLCALSGHDYLLKTAGNRMFLQCPDCGRETPGWRVGRTREIAR